jgi:hypothetical protein
MHAGFLTSSGARRQIVLRNLWLRESPLVLQIEIGRRVIKAAECSPDLITELELRQIS